MDLQQIFIIHSVITSWASLKQHLTPEIVLIVLLGAIAYAYRHAILHKYSKFMYGNEITISFEISKGLNYSCSNKYNKYIEFIKKVNSNLVVSSQYNHSMLIAHTRVEITKGVYYTYVKTHQSSESKSNGSVLTIDYYLLSLFFLNDDVFTNFKKSLKEYYIKKYKSKIILVNTIIGTRNPIQNPVEKIDNYINRYPEHSEIVLKIVEQLKNPEYFIKTGNRYKAGFIFHGRPGTGKTYAIMAIANYYKYNIVTINLNNIKNEHALYNALNSKNNNDNDYKNIYVFEEIDTFKESHKRVEKSKKDNICSNCNKKYGLGSVCPDGVDRPVTLHTLLTILDGIYPYDGEIFIATTNHLEVLDPALVRKNRLTPIYFDK